MFFYERTIVIADRFILDQLVQYFGVERLIILIQEGLLDITYTESLVGIITRSENNTQYHDTVEFTSPQHTYQEELRKICIGATGKTGKGRRLAQQIQDKIHVSGHDPIILEGARKSILDQEYVHSATKIALRELVPDFGETEFFFHTKQTAKGIVVETDINYVALNEQYHQRVSPNHSSLSSEYILAHILDVEKELFFASSNLSELATSNLSSKLAKQKIDYVIARSAKSLEELNNFKSFILNDAKAIQEAINASRIDLDDLISILKRSKKFKKWIVGLKPEADLVKSYYKEVTRRTLIDKLPGKSVRWGLFTGLGILADLIATGGYATMAGAALGALDNFYIDRLISGWKPNQFIEKDFKKLISST